MIETPSRRSYKRKRLTQASNARKLVWYKAYRERMDAGLERCRRCVATEELTFDHVVPFASGGKFTFRNATILCRPCNVEKADSHWPLRSLAEEERVAAPQAQWARLAGWVDRAPPVATPDQHRLT